MPEGPSTGHSTGTRESTPESGGIWRGIRTLLFGDEQEETLRDRIEDAIDEHEDEGGKTPAGDLAPIERQMLKNLLHFGERDAGDVGVPRADIIAVEETTSFAGLVQLFAEAGHSRLPVYRDELDTIIGMVRQMGSATASGASTAARDRGGAADPAFDSDRHLGGDRRARPRARIDSARAGGRDRTRSAASATADLVRAPRQLARLSRRRHIVSVRDCVPSVGPLGARYKESFIWAWQRPGFLPTI